MSQKSIIDLISAVDLQDLKHLVLIRNDVSGTECVEEGSVQMLELQEKSIVLLVPPNTCVEGHGLTLCMIRLPVGKAISRYPARPEIYNNAFEIIGKVFKIERPEKRKEYWTITVNFTQYDVALWEAFIVSYIQRQEKINELRPKHE